MSALDDGAEPKKYCDHIMIVEEFKENFDHDLYSCVKCGLNNSHNLNNNFDKSEDNFYDNFDIRDLIFFNLSLDKDYAKAVYEEAKFLSDDKSKKDIMNNMQSIINIDLENNKYVKTRTRKKK